MKNWFTIGGSFRSGTTLLRLCLDSHPQIHCFDEGFSYPMLKQKGEPKARVFSDATISCVGFKIPVIAHQVPTHLAAWTARFGIAPKIIWTQRDVVQIVASMKATWGPSAFQRFEKNVVEWRKNPAFATAYAPKLRAIDGLSTAEKPLAYAALLAIHKQETRKRISNVHLVQYEQLVTQPEPTLRAALVYLGAEWNEAVLAHHALSHAEPNVGGTDPTRAIDPASVELWKERLTDREVTIIRSVEGAINV